jgi:predicted phage terminase large subunit-like protein
MGAIALNSGFPLIDVPKIEVHKDERGEVQVTGLLPIEVFVATYFEHLLRTRRGRPIQTPFFHREMYYLYEYPELFKPQDGEPSIIWVCPRGYGKSIVNFFSVLYDALVTKKYGEQLLIGATGPLTERWINKIKTELTTNELIIRDFGNMCTEGQRDGKWTNEELLLANGERIYGKSAGAGMRGYHPGKIIKDDIENDEQALSPFQIEKMEEWIKGTVINMQNDEDSVLFWTGTFLERDSVLQKAYECNGWDAESFFRIKHDAEWTEDAEEEHKGVSTWHPYNIGESIWPQKYPTRWLRAREKKIGSSKYLAEFMNDPKAKDRAIFSKEYLRYYEPEELPKLMRSIVIIDPAVGQKQINCESAIIALGVDAGRNPGPDIYCLDFESGHWDEMTLVRKAINYYLQWRSDYVGIEEVSFSTYLLTAVEMESARKGIYLPVEAKKPRSKDKITRAKSVRPLFERGHVRFLRTQTILIEQLTNFPRKGVLKDLVDAFVYGLMDFMRHWEDVDESNKKAGGQYGAIETEEDYAIPELAL